jgi:acyl-CoA dehydrogenase
VPKIAIDIIDDAIQMHGAAGVSQDFPLAFMYTNARTLRLADGPDEVHRMVVARSELRPYVKPRHS